MKRLLLGAASALFVLALAVPLAFGQEQVTLSLSPQTFDISANPGETVSNSFKIVNGSDEPIVLGATIKNFNVSGEDGGVALTEEETNFSVADWIDVDPMNVTIDARGSQVFDFVISVPASAEPGSHFGAIILKSENVDLNPTGPSVAQEIGPLILVKVAGDVTEEATIDSFGSTAAVWTKSPIELETRVKNSGNVHFKPRGTITIKNMFGSEVTTINLQEQNILPDSVRRLVDEWDPGVFAFGRYTADLSLVYGEENVILTASTAFFVFPLLSTVLALGGVVLLVVIVKGRHRLAEAGRALSGR
jgi:hypothetical protein